jgi:hypothetical protein
MSIFPREVVRDSLEARQDTREALILLLRKSSKIVWGPPEILEQHWYSCSESHWKWSGDSPKHSRNIGIVAQKVIGNSLGTPQNTRETLVKLLRKSSKLVWRPPKIFGKYWYDILKIFDKVPENYFFDVGRFWNLVLRKIFWLRKTDMKKSPSSQISISPNIKKIVFGYFIKYF